MDQFRTQHQTITPALIDTVKEAWLAYFTKKFSKSLPEADRPTPGQEEEAWLKINSKDSAWFQTCRDRDEKFILHFDALKSSKTALETASQSAGKSQAEVHALIDASLDVLSAHLDTIVRPDSS